jgi:hypothetical protein
VETACSQGKSPAERNCIIRSGLQPDVIGAGRRQRPGAFLMSTLGQLRYPQADLAAAGVDQRSATRLGIQDLDPS